MENKFDNVIVMFENEYYTEGGKSKSLRYGQKKTMVKHSSQAKYLSHL